MRSKKLRSLTPEVFAGLLACLDAEREQAALKYERVRQTLVTFFTFRNAIDPEALADETLNRVAYRLAEGQEITTGNPLYYFLAVARNVWRETSAQQQRNATFVEHAPALADTVPSVEAARAEFEQRLAHEKRLDCLNQCLDQLPAEDRTLLLDYHEGKGQAKIAQRQALTARFGITLGSLRNRVCRIRDRLAQCLHHCAERER